MTKLVSGQLVKKKKNGNKRMVSDYVFLEDQIAYYDFISEIYLNLINVQFRSNNLPLMGPNWAI